MFPRSSGLLLHATSLPGGRLGPEAYRFVDFLAAAGQRWWQLLPVGPPGPGRSPYAALSAFAGDEKLWGGGAPDAEPLDAPWVADYALFRALRDAQGAPWTKWPRALRDRQPAALARARRTHARRVARYTRLQGAFDAQWRALKRYANERGIGLIGDVPLFVAHDSADVWAHRDLYKLKANGAPQVVAGVPPDYFSERGQRWGNPVYRWDRIKHRRFAWWIARLRRGFELFDALRLDHFLGFLRTWEIPAHAKDARRGAWTKGPRAAFFRAGRRALGRRLLIAEDLGRSASACRGCACCSSRSAPTPRTGRTPSRATASSTRAPTTTTRPPAGPAPAGPTRSARSCTRVAGRRTSRGACSARRGRAPRTWPSPRSRTSSACRDAPA